MDQVTKVRRHIKREEWKSIISECRASGMTVKAWCKANGIVEQTYYRNLKMLREEMLKLFRLRLLMMIVQKSQLYSKSSKLRHRLRIRRLRLSFA